MSSPAASVDAERMYDALAPRYDEEVGGTAGAALAKARSTNALRELFGAGSLVLDIGCGTGVDACNLAGRGVEVVATDLSDAMLTRTRERAIGKGVSPLVHPVHLPARRLGELPSEYRARPFDGAYSLFGVLNLEEDLSSVRDALAGLLKPGAPLLVGLVNPVVLWEIVLYPLLLRFDKAVRKVRRVTTMRISNVRAERIPVFLLTPDEFAKRMAPAFRLEHVEGTNILVPPPHLDKYARTVPRFVSVMSQWERRIADHPPWNSLGYFSLLTLRRSSP